MNGRPDTRAQALAQALRKYNTGKPCLHGHVADRYTRTGSCCACHREVAARQALRERNILAARLRGRRVFTVEMDTDYVPAFLMIMDAVPNVRVTDTLTRPQLTPGAYFDTPDGRRVYNMPDGRVSHTVNADGSIERVHLVGDVPADQQAGSPKRPSSFVEVTIR